MRNLYIIALLAILSLVACSEEPQKSVDISESEAYVERQGYVLISVLEEQSLFFEKQNLTNPAYAPILQVQPLDSAQYIDKELTSVELIVQNHPLELFYSSKKTRITVYLYQDKVIGGWSLPVTSSEGACRQCAFVGWENGGTSEARIESRIEKIMNTKKLGE